MNKNTITTIVIFFAIIAGLIWIAGPEGKKENLANSSSVLVGTIAVEESNFDFGTISMAAGNVSHLFKVKNTGNFPVSINKIYTSCMCTTAKLMADGKEFGPFGMPGHGFIPKINASIPAREDGIVEVIYDPAAHGPAGIGKIERLVTVEVENGSSIEFMFSAFVQP